jgi:hypothetical protein
MFALIIVGNYEMAASGSLQVVGWFESWNNGHTDAHRQHGDLIRLVSFLEKGNWD